MEAPEPEDLLIYGFLDPREAFLDHIFTPGRFSVQSILKALSVSLSLVIESFYQF